MNGTLFLLLWFWIAGLVFLYRVIRLGLRHTGLPRGERRRVPPPPPTREDTARQMLRERYVRGEITTAEYEKIVAVLIRLDPPASPLEAPVRYGEATPATPAESSERRPAPRRRPTLPALRVPSGIAGILLLWVGVAMLWNVAADRGPFVPVLVLFGIWFFVFRGRGWRGGRT